MELVIEFLKSLHSFLKFDSIINENSDSEMAGALHLSKATPRYNNDSRLLQALIAKVFVGRHPSLLGLGLRFFGHLDLGEGIHSAFDFICWDVLAASKVLRHDLSSGLQRIVKVAGLIGELLNRLLRAAIGFARRIHHQIHRHLPNGIRAQRKSITVYTVPSWPGDRY